MIAEFSARARSRDDARSVPLSFRRALARGGARVDFGGQARCYNISEGFEGALDEKRKRGAVGGWKAGGLPWTQS